MNLILIEPDEIKNSTVFLAGRRCDHIRKVLRSKPGDKIKVGLLEGDIGVGRILEIGPKHVVLELNFDTLPPPQNPTALILALPRPIMLKRVLAQAASMGVARIFLINANRVEKSFFNASLLEKQNYQIFFRQGLEQAVDTRLPEISIHHRFKPFVEDVLPEILNDYPVRLVAHPDAANPLPQVVRPPLTAKALLAVGPEGGWVDYEIQKFSELHFKPFSLGARILRVDTAVPALIAQLDLLRQL